MKLFSVALVAVLLVIGSMTSACQREMPREELPEVSEEGTIPSIEEEFWEPGTVYLKLAKGSDKSVSTRISQSLRASSLRSATNDVVLEQVFDISGEYAPAMIREGLDRWYKISFDKDIDVQSVIDQLRSEGMVETVHGEIKLTRAETKYTPLRAGFFPDLNSGYSRFYSNPDPLLSKQWHYSNEGYMDSFLMGADINLFEAWDITTGDPEVIVAIIDSGVDYNHPDLRESMWEGEGGIHGKNFFNDSFILNPSYHGTHVAGTVAARNNNGIGVSGVAGGDGTAKSGVRLMSCQVYGPDDNKGDARSAKNDQFAQAFVWAAEHGAVIANCSWGYAFVRADHINNDYYKEFFSQAGNIIQEGIDFFIKYAGNDKDGNRKPGSMMSGGVVIFGAGNDSAVDIDIIPASYSGVIAVGAFDPDFKLSHYSNCGTWVDILAPGGNVGDFVNRGILSTVPDDFRNMWLGTIPCSSYVYPDVPMEQGTYAYANGTSMATPHVTGIAALMVSHFGKRGDFTNTMLKDRLLGAIKDYNHEIRNAEYKGKMGAGYVDAALALSDPEKVAPEQVAQIDVKELGYYDATIAWAVTKDSDARSHRAFSYSIFISDAEVKDFSNPSAVVYTFEKQEGEELTHFFGNLETNKTYHVAIIVSDRSGNKSEAVHTKFTTKLNHSPEITNLPTEPFIILDTQPYFAYSFKVEDKNGHEWKFKGQAIPDGVTVKRNGDNLEMTVIVNGLEGNYAFALDFEDELGGKQRYEIPFSVVTHTAPISNLKIKNLFLLENGKSETIILKDAFTLAPGLTEVTIDAVSNNTGVATVEVKNGELIVTPHKSGVATITLHANDGIKKSSTTFIVRVTKEGASDVQALYPLPAHSYLKILLKSADETIKAIVTSSTGEKLLEENLKVNPVTREATLEVDRLVPGVYNLIVETSSSKNHRTFIKN